MKKSSAVSKAESSTLKFFAKKYCQIMAITGASKANTFGNKYHGIVLVSDSLIEVGKLGLIFKFSLFFSFCQTLCLI